MYALLIFILGLLIGSFLNVCIYRIPRDESVSYPPSHCTGCGARIKPYDLFPVFSYILLKGKCRSCGEKISIRYPLIELLVGFLFIALYITYGISFELLKFMILIPFVVVIGFIDLETTDVYFKTTLTGSIAGIILLILGNYLGRGIWEYVYGALLGVGVISLIVILTRGMGWGDAEICFLCGIFLGLKLTLLMLFISFVIGGAIGVILIIFKKKSPKDYIPFGPFITLAALFCIYFGESLLGWYFSLF
jgi:leader peptidase (prepilin peptidase)/N-methyltransferase